MLALWVPGQSWAQRVQIDTTRTYDLDEIVVSHAEERRPALTTVQRLSLADLAPLDAASVANIARLIPAAHVQTNSRGETLVYLRNAGERQIALFFDGALLNIPWDNRIDLSLVPAGLLDGMTVAKGVPSVLYGTNVLGGAINLRSRTLDAPGRTTEIQASGGTESTYQLGLTHLGKTDRFTYTVGGSYQESDGLPIPEGADLAFNQEAASLRNNTDFRRLNGFVRGQYGWASGTQLGVTVLHTEAEKGVAPEGHEPPEEARFWRYSDWRNTTAIVHGLYPLRASTVLRLSTWVNRFNQHIDAYPSAAFQAFETRQEDLDWSVGSRLTLSHETGRNAFRAALNWLTSEHEQLEREATPAGLVVSEPRLAYRQHVYSVGLEYEQALPLPALRLLTGLSVDGIATPKTGDKPARDPQQSLTGNLSLFFQPTEAVGLRASAGRKVRFPTMRELFGVALNRFRLNPDLRPETSLVGELGVTLTSEVISGEVVGFVTRTFDTIDQRRNADNTRQRINLDGSRVWGVEVGATARPFRRLRLNGHVTLTHTRALEAGSSRPLTEKPDVLATLRAQINLPANFGLSLGATHTGRAYGQDASNALVKLPRATVFDVRTSWLYYRALPFRLSLEVFGRIDNVTDALTLPQLGLPGPGRQLRFGLTVTV